MSTTYWSVDLHSHTRFSDGRLTPTQLAHLAKANGVRVLAVTDHDHVGGIDEAMTVGAELGLEVIPGAELSVSYDEFDDIHLLAYYFAWHDARLQSRLETFRVARESRAERILERINAKLRDEGRQPIPYAAVKAQVEGAFGRPHLAAALVERGYVPDLNSAFTEYLIPCNVPKYHMTAEEAVGLIGQSRGLSAVAHPIFISPHRGRLRRVIEALRAHGLDGIEAYHSHHSAEERLYFIQLARQMDMVVTGGSDYHGMSAKSGVADDGGKLGSLRLPYGFAVQLRRLYLQRYPLLLLLRQWPPAAAAAVGRALQAHYHLSHLSQLHQAVHAATGGNPDLLPTSLSVELPEGETTSLEALMAESRQLGRRVVGIPWEGVPLEGPEGLYAGRAMTAERFRHTPVERLTHEIVHEAILAQLS